MDANQYKRIFSTRASHFKARKKKKKTKNRRRQLGPNLIEVVA